MLYIVKLFTSVLFLSTLTEEQATMLLLCTVAATGLVAFAVCFPYTCQNDSQVAAFQLSSRRKPCVLLILVRSVLSAGCPGLRLAFFLCSTHGASYVQALGVVVLP